MSPLNIEARGTHGALHALLISARRAKLATLAGRPAAYAWLLEWATSGGILGAGEMWTERARWLGALAIWCLTMGALAGLMGGALHAIRVLRANDYLEQEMFHLAARVLAEQSWGGALLGSETALIGLVGFVAFWPLGRLWYRDWTKGATAAVSAVLILPAYVACGLHLNRHFLPGIFELPSIAANIGLTLLAGAIWWLTSRFLALRLARPPRWTRRLPGPVWTTAAVAAAMALTGAPLLATPPRLDPPRQNVLLIVIDTLRPDRLGHYGYTRDTSPHLDTLAAESWIFKQAVAPAPWTKPSVASLFTGLYPSHHGIGTAGWTHTDSAGSVSADALHPEIQTLAELLAEGGYRTAAFGENHHLIPRFGFDQGFQDYELHLSGPNYLSSIEVLPRFFDWLDDVSDGFFAYLHFVDVHFPYLPPAEYAGRWAGTMPGEDYNTVEFMDWAQKREREGPLELAPEVVQHMSDSYDEEIRFLDAQVGAMLEDLKERGLYEKSLVIVTSDHGEEFMEHGEIAHATSLYDVLLKIPLLVKFPCPGSRCGHRIIHTQVELLDLMPTILQAVGLDVPESLQGRSLLEFSDESEQRIAIGEYGEWVSLRTPRSKYILSHKDRSRELYDLDDDPAESRNLADERPDDVAAFQARLDMRRDELRDRPARERLTVTVDEETQRALEALGYAQ
jgi:arylsulfatase A-like enzyme